jgi:hypothetical protein
MQRGLLIQTDDPDGVAPAYEDPFRIASWSRAYKSDLDYAEPPPLSELPQPSLGWYGDVQGGIFRDRWVTQRAERYVGISELGRQTYYPVWAKVAITQNLSASTRGNRMWGSVSISAMITDYGPGSTYWGTRFRGMTNPDYAYRFPVSPPTTPWAETINTTHIIDASQVYPGFHAWQYKILLLRITPFAPHGRYFARNDWCRCWTTATTEVFQAKPV